MSSDTVISILRPQDLLCLACELVNLRASADGRSLVPRDPAAESYVIVGLPSQAMAEAVQQGPLPLPPPLRTVVAGPSRLVFRLPPGASVPLTVEGLLRWRDWMPVVAPTALPRDTPPHAGIPPSAPPTARETAIEFPWRLLLSPDRDGQWQTENGASDSPYHQLWSAVLRTKDGPGGDLRALAAVEGFEVPGFTPSLRTGSRRQVARLSSDFHLPVADGGHFTPVPLRAKRMELTTLGANVEMEAGWAYPEYPPGAEPPGYVALDLRQYQHTAALGRDHLVRTVTVGYLCPTGHRAVVLETVERVPWPVQHGDGHETRGVLVRTAELIVQQPVVEYGPLAGAFARGGREFPFTKVRITTTSARISPRDPDDGPFWLFDPDGERLPLRAVGEDVVGNPVDFSLPMVFVPYRYIGDHESLFFTYFSPGFEDARTVRLHGQTVAFAADAGRPGSTALKTSSVTLTIELPPGVPNPNPDLPVHAEAAPASYIPRFLPRVHDIVAAVPAVDDLLGTAGAPRALVWDTVYLNHGFGAANRAQTFVTLTADLPVGLSPQRGGGLASPALTAKALSRTLGPVSAPDALQAGKVDLSVFDGMKFLGTVTLKDLLDGQRMGFVGGDTADAPVSQAQLDQRDFLVNPPRVTTRRLPASGPEPERVETRFLWKPPLTKAKTEFLDLKSADLLLDVRTSRVHGAEPVTVALGRLRGARFTFAGAMTTRIGVLAFRSESGKKVDVEARDVHVDFVGPLAFVNTLRDVLPADGFSDPPFLTVDAQGVVAGYTLGVPTVAVGIFSIQNIAVTAALSLPFTDRPAGMRFALAERHKPFLVTVSLFGGGGFFAVEAGAKGLEQVEASIEFGASVSLNLGVASGGVSVMAGIYFGMKGASVELTGYLRCGGYLDILGLISLSVEFYLAFTYRDKDGGGSEVWGQASLRVSVKIAFISTSVTLSVERRFAGAGGDPSFADSVTPAQWTDYLKAFA
ncbi:hypothetical protein [Streptomyces sp. NPDC056144]|uniref:hypothetical protein n=1 Tax=unclassified Streptomyces TaxID=2593676 RepID=UPI0035DB8CBD